MKTCPDCNGDGVIDKGTDDEQRCPTCGGLGFVPDDDDDGEEVIRAAEALTKRPIRARFRRRRRRTIRSAGNT